MIFGAKNKEEISRLTIENNQLKNRIESLEEKLLLAENDNSQLVEDMSTNDSRARTHEDLNKL
jgi:hypothetical protein